MPESENELTRGRLFGGMLAMDGKGDCERWASRLIAGTPLHVARGLAESMRWRPQLRGRQTRTGSRSVLRGEDEPGSVKSGTTPKAGKDSRVRVILFCRRSGLTPERLNSTSASGFRLFALNVCLVSRPVTAMVTHCRHALDRRQRRQRSWDQQNLPGFKFSLQQHQLELIQ